MPDITMLLLVLIVTKVSVSARQITVDTNGNDTGDCLEGKYPCSSLGYVLNHLKSNDCVNIASNSLLLATMVKLHNLNAITIRGQSNTIVMCNNTGGVSCNNCSNVVIEGITWDGCGNPKQQDPRTQDSTGGLTFTNIANLSISNNIFQNSKVRALYLHLVAGTISVTSTEVINNANYDPVFCLLTQSGFFRCLTRDYSATGGLYIEEASAVTSLYISKCMFNNNGHFGIVNNTDPMTIRYEDGEIADGTAIKVFHTNMLVPIRIVIEQTSFVHHRGRSGGAVNINTTNSPIIKLHDLKFMNNSVVQTYVNSSALFIILNSLAPTTMIPLLNLSFCNFINNSDGRNVIGFIIAGQPACLLTSNCHFIDNKMYQVGIVEFNMLSQSLVDFVDSDIVNNSGSSLIFMQLRSTNLNISLHNIQAVSNFGTSVVRRGGLIVFRVFEDNATVNISKLLFCNNQFERRGGGLYINGLFHTSFKLYLQDSQFNDNVGQGSGTIIYSFLTSDNPYLVSIYNSSFISNVGEGSIIRIIKQSLMEDLLIVRKPAFLLLGQSTNFLRNSAGAVGLSNTILVGVGNTTFESNTADNGAAVYLSDAYIMLGISSFQLMFNQNFAFERGGAIFIDLSTNSNVSICNWLLQMKNYQVCSQSNLPIAEGCPVIDGQFLCHEITLQSASGNFNLCSFSFSQNNASVAGDAIFYQAPDLPTTEDASDPTSIFYVPQSEFCGLKINTMKDLSTQPFQLKLNEPAKCIDANCSTYCITNITLGEVIEIPAQIVGYNNKSAESTVFFVECIENCITSNGDINYIINGPNPILVSDMFRGTIIIGKQKGPPLHLQLMSTTITLHLIVELAPCRSGYTYNKKTMQCECYTTDGVVSCTPPPTTIRRDYWFGMVDNTITVSRCPYTYCNFDRQEVSPGRFLLPSVQDDQCDSHRTGPACGSCDDGYTLPFDSVECINVNKCHPGYTVLVIVGVIFYWTLIIASVLFLTWLLHHDIFKCSLGYLYGIIYYYSLVDIFLGQVVNRSDDFSNLISIFGGTIFKLYPGFLFGVCFTRNMSAIDQYIIHYVHPTAVLALVWIISRLAKCSTRLSNILHLPAIPTICLIFTLAYVSIADTSLQLLRYIRFADVDGSFIYISPAIRYLTGRHKAYFIIAVLFELIIVAGLPLLLLFQPIVARYGGVDLGKIDLFCTKLNLTPLLGEFQGCYKDRFHWFAGVYFLSRQVTLVVTVANYADPYIEQYLLMIICVAVALLHHLLQPYKSDKLNQFDGILLHTLLLAVSLQIIGFSDEFSHGFSNNSILGIAYLLYFLPIALSSVFLGYYVYTKWQTRRKLLSQGENFPMEYADNEPYS